MRVGKPGGRGVTTGWSESVSCEAVECGREKLRGLSIGMEVSGSEDGGWIKAELVPRCGGKHL